MQPDPNTWSLYDWYTYVPVKFWLTVLGGLFAICLAAFKFGKWVEGRRKERNIQKLEDELSNQKEKPQTIILVSKESISLGKYSGHLKFSFTGDNIIHPGIIEELLGWISDSLPVTGAFDLEGAMNSNKFCEPFEIETTDDGLTWYKKITKEGGETLAEFAYTYIGASPSGVHIVRTADWGGGSGVFCDVLLLALEPDRVVDPQNKERPFRDRILLKCIGHIALGDRYEGSIELKGNQLHIEKNRNPISGTWPENGIIQID